MDLKNGCVELDRSSEETATQKQQGEFKTSGNIELTINHLSEE